MAKSSIARKPQPPAKKVLIPEKYQDIIYIGIIIISVFIFLSKAISGGGFAVFDNIASMSFQNFLNDASNKGEFPLWIPYIFSGMPSYASLMISGERGWDIIPAIFWGITEFIGTIFSNDTARMACFYSLYGVGMYLFMRFKKHERSVALFTALAAVFSTWVITWVMIGHNTKPVVLSMLPFIFLFMEKLKEKFSLIYGVLLIFAVHIMMEAGHLQMIFYCFSALGIYLVYELVYTLLKKEKVIQIIRVGALLALAGGVAFLMSSDRYFSTMEYTPYSTRGSAPILKTDKQHQDASGGNDYEYATMWSYSPGELMTFLVPSYYGFGNREYRDQMLPTYWGQKESEDSPPYMGIIVFGFAIFGFIFYRKNVFIQYLLVLSIFSIIMSFGKNLPVLYDLFYNYFPSFNKFRAPSMSLAQLHFAVPILAGFGITGFLKMRENFDAKAKKIINIALICSAAFLVLGFLFSAVFESAYISAVSNSRYINQMMQYYGQGIVDELSGFITSNMLSDWYFNGFFLLIAFALIYAYVKQKLNKSILLIGLLAILLIDLWRVDWRPMEVSEQDITTNAFTSKAELYNVIKVDKEIYRIADFTARPANVPAYFLLENINGYHAAKLRVYQDLMDVANPDQYAGSTSEIYNPFLWNILNVKYIVLQQPAGSMKTIYENRAMPAFVYLNPGMLPRAFFVNTPVVAKQMDILLHLKNGDFNPIDTAFVEEKLPVKIDSALAEAKVKIIDHDYQYIKMEVTATGNNLLFVSEVWYPPCWKAYIDGKEVPVYKTNFAFRSIIIPKGKHLVEMKYISEKFQQGRLISIIVNAIAVLALAFGIYIEKKKKIKRVE